MRARGRGEGVVEVEGEGEGACEGEGAGEGDGEGEDMMGGDGPYGAYMRLYAQMEASLKTPTASPPVRTSSAAMRIPREPPIHFHPSYATLGSCLRRKHAIPPQNAFDFTDRVGKQAQQRRCRIGLAGPGCTCCGRRGGGENDRRVCPALTGPAASL